MYKYIDGRLYARMIIFGSQELGKHKQEINDLNVFPIPDGDTGDNMHMTVNGGANEVDSAQEDLSHMAELAAHGMFMGARGNSGVILSRIFAGISKTLSNTEHADTQTFIRAMRAGVSEAYASVSHPVEGTILTVYREAVESCERESLSRPFESFEDLFAFMLPVMRSSLEKTPSMLDVLKKAGVVDSGGAGLICIFRGMNKAFDDTAVIERENTDTRTAKKIDLTKFNENSELTFGYCTEFALQLMTAKVGNVAQFDEKEIFDYLNSVGESVVAFRNNNMIRVHVHTKTPGDILNHCQKWGEFLTMKIENMNVQHNESIHAEKKEETEIPSMSFKKKYAFVTVASGEGIINSFKELGADYVIPGGQSMNPSVKDFITAFESLNAENIVVFPNNGNVILTANQAAQNYSKSNVIVIANKDIGTGYSAMSVIDTDAEPQQLVNLIQAGMDGVVTAMVSRANKDTEFGNVTVHNGDYIGFHGDDILSVTTDRKKTLTDLAEKLDASDYGIIILIKGKDAEAKEAQELEEELKKKYRGCEIITIDGQQPTHDYIMILE